MRSRSQWWEIGLKDEKAQAEVEAIHKHEDAKKSLERRFVDKVDKLQRGDELPPGVMKMVKVFVAVKRKIQPGDKMAGRHGNKGVVSMIVPVEDMPFLEDGTHVDVVLNPLGVPSRMNVEQILETHLGWACRGWAASSTRRCRSSTRAARPRPCARRCSASTARTSSSSVKDDELELIGDQLKTGVSVATPVFDGAREPDIVELLTAAGFDSSGQVQLFDGRTGEPFDPG